MHPTKPANLLLSSLRHRNLLKAKLSLVEDELFRVLQSSPNAQTLYEASLHPIKSGGKRLRPLLSLLSCEAVGSDFKKALPVATAIELIHTASLIHDDLIDDDVKRREAQTVHVRYDRDTAILSGDLLISKAMQIISENSPVRVRRIVSSACVEMSEGEYMDMVFKSSPEDATEENYLKMARKKTGVLVGAAAACGAIMGGGTPEQVLSLSRYGESLGLSLQLRDDVQEILTAEVTSVSTRTCLDGQGSNLVLIHSLRNSDNSSQDLLRGIVTSNENDNGLKDALQVFESSMSIQHVQRLSEKFEKEATNVIKGMAFSNQKILEDLAEFVVRH
jgi:geranylgeranyl diphosphate synthase type I